MVSLLQVSQLLGVVSLAFAQAPVKDNSPPGEHFTAEFSKKIEGSVSFSSTENGSVLVDVNISGLPSEGGPFAYHIHELPVPSDGNCTGTKGHLNPYNGTVNGTTAADKEAGDLSGKHGVITGQSLETSYIEPYISLNEEDPTFVGNLSVVVHFANSSRIACANITSDSSHSNDTSSSISTANGGVTNSGGLAAFFGAVTAALSFLI